MHIRQHEFCHPQQSTTDRRRHLTAPRMCCPSPTARASFAEDAIRLTGLPAVQPAHTNKFFTPVPLMSSPWAKLCPLTHFSFGTANLAPSTALRTEPSLYTS